MAVNWSERKYKESNVLRKVRNLLNKKWGAAVLSGAIALFLFAGVVVAATVFNVNIPSTVTVNQFVAGGGGGGTGGSPANTIQVYPSLADANASTNQITTSSNITWPTVTQFGNVTRPFWIKNTGTGAVTVTISGASMPTGLTLTSAPTPVAVAAVVEMSGTLAADGTAAPGTPSFTTVFTSTD